MHPPDPLLARIYRDPYACCQLSLAEWDRLIRQARRAGLLARLHGVLALHRQLDMIPLEARWHFVAATTLADKQQIAVRWEIREIAHALSTLGFPVIVLKGGAYVMASLAAAQGRLFSDIDILVPRERLAAVEAALMLAGWHPSALSDYDQRYYRRWMHEIPPMQHVKRATVIDVHHAILPDTARHHPDSAKLRNRAVPVPDAPNVFVLSPEDMLLHSATHLFHDGELPHGLRDLTDLDLLFQEFSGTPGFWNRLFDRAVELDLTRPLFHAQRYVQHFLDTPIPSDFVNSLKSAAPGHATQILLDAIFKRALAPIHPSCDDALSPLARKAAFVRAHWLRMPAHLLLPHLFHKAVFPADYGAQTT
jgi:hypothetical protein